MKPLLSLRTLSSLFGAFSIAHNGVVVSAFSLARVGSSPSMFTDDCTYCVQSPQLRRAIVQSTHHRRQSLKCSQPSVEVHADATPSDVANEDTRTYYSYLLSQFQGDFDNYNQVVEDRRRGLTPGDGGGHEDIHCTLVPCPQCDRVGDHQNQWILAAFYFNGDPCKIFRFRAYHLIPPPPDAPDRPVRMKLHTLQPELEQKLRQCSEQPCTWWDEAWTVWRKPDSIEKITAKEWERFQSAGMSTLVTSLTGCDVLWDPRWDPSKHSYLYTDEYGELSRSEGSEGPPLPSGQSYHATMEAGSKGAIVDSISMIPGKRILIKDELSLWRDEFWINDRGYDPDVVLDAVEGEDVDGRESGDMPFVYGNRRGVPYKLKRVANIASMEWGAEMEELKPSLALERCIHDAELEWTMGDEYRSPDLYQNKMRDMGITTE